MTKMMRAARPHDRFGRLRRAHGRGEVHLELDDGEGKKLAPRDVVIQNGTRHAWRNKSSQPATMLFVLVGAQRKG